MEELNHDLKKARLTLHVRGRKNAVHDACRLLGGHQSWIATEKKTCSRALSTRLEMRQAQLEANLNIAELYLA